MRPQLLEVNISELKLNKFHFCEEKFHPIIFSNMALSSTKLKTLIDNKKWTDFQNITEEFHQSHHRHDIPSLQKMTNLIAFIFGNEQSITVEELRKMSNSFVQAIESMIIAQIDETTSKKVLTSCFHVIKRLCKDVCTDGICHLMPIGKKLNLSRNCGSFC